MSLAVAVRAENVEWLLLFHLVAAFLLVGGMIVVALACVAALRASDDRLIVLRELGFRTNLLLVLPSFVVVYGLGIWLADKEYGETEPDWLDLAFPLTDLSGLLGVVVLTILQWWLLRRTRAARGAHWPERIAAGLPLVVLALLGAVIFLMTAKVS